MEIVCLVYLAGQLKNHNSGRSAKEISLWQPHRGGIPSISVISYRDESERSDIKLVIYLELQLAHKYFESIWFVYK